MTWQHVRTLPSIPKYSGFPLRTPKGVLVKTVWTLGQAIRMWSYYEKNRSILERRSQKTDQTRLTSVRALYSQSTNLSRIKFSEAYK
jgi:hypothetical protein